MRVVESIVEGIVEGIVESIVESIVENCENDVGTVRMVETILA